MTTMVIDAADADRDLKQRVRGYLFSRQVGTLRQMQVEADEGVVTLTGKVRSFYEKQLALNACQRVAGVYKLVDNVQVAMS